MPITGLSLTVGGLDTRCIRWVKWLEVKGIKSACSSGHFEENSGNSSISVNRSSGKL